MTCHSAFLLLAATLFAANAFADDFVPVQLKVPDGYVVEVAAAPPLVSHPLMADFDHKGRLYIAANCGENLPRPDLEKRLPNFVQRLEDTDKDGKFDKATVFADKMTFPQGCLWFDGSLYVASSGAIWKLTDKDDDGVADERVKLVGDFGYTGNAADVHGPFRGPDGRIYWCEGRHGHEIKDAEGKLISKGKAARIFSCRPDGSDVQTFCTGGMDNPVEICFTPEGEMLGTVNLMYASPRRGDCLVHWQYGGVYPREDFAESLGSEFVRTGPLLPEVHNFGHVAVSGLCHASFGSPEFKAERETLFVTEFNTHRIKRVILKAKDSSYAVESVDDFAVAESNDFHPTDILEVEEDGSLLVIDTGGWFRIGCPVSQVAKAHIPGAIYRIRRANAKPRVRGPLRTDQSIDRLADWLRDTKNPNDNALAWQTSEKHSKPNHAREWSRALSRIGTSAAELRLIELLQSESQWTRQTAVRGLLYADPAKYRRERGLRDGLLNAIRNDSLFGRRVALSTLGRLYAHEPKLAEEIFEAMPSLPDDRNLEHAFAYALIETGDREGIAKQLSHPDESLRNAAAKALEELRRPRADIAAHEWLEIPAASFGKKLSDEEVARLLAAEKSLPAGDLTRGKNLFHSADAACAKCHRIGSDGGQVGPDLTFVGKSRSERDLLESMLFPSASFARGFAPYTVATKDGKVVSGIVLGEKPAEIRLGIDAQNSTWIKNENVEAIRAADVSIMPDNVAAKMSPQQLADLIAYMKSLK